MFFKVLFLTSLFFLCTHQTLLNTNRVNITSNFTLYYGFTDDSKIYLSFYAQNNAGWVAMAFGITQSNTDVIRVYMSGTTANVQDLWSTGDFAWVLDTTLLGGTTDVFLDSGSRTNGVLNITVYRLLNTGDQYDYQIPNPVTVKCLFFWSNTDDITQKYTNTPTPLNVYLTSSQICNSFCTAQSMTCVGPDSTDCTCNSGSFFSSSTGTCISCIANCSVCTNTNSCSTCTTNFFIQANPLNCTLCTNGNQYKNTATGTCTICDPFCQQCASDIVCGSCQSGYFLNSQNVCTACIANCSSCNSTTGCIDCNPGFFYANSLCNACPQNCNSCNATTCIQCMANFYFSSTNCVACTSLGLIQLGANDGTGTCSSCVPYCKVCATTSTCTQCGDGYLANGNAECDPCSVSFCKTCSPITTCTTCLTGYSLFSNTCQNCLVQNCLGCDTSGKCISCSTGFTLFSGICTNCTVPNCAYCNAGAPNVCVYCADGYFLEDDGTCDQGNVESCSVPWGNSSCVACESEFQLIQNNACYQCSGKNCSSCSSNNMCSKCSTQFLLQNNLCSKCITNCDSCSDQISCLACSAGYYLSSNQCSACAVSQCQTCNTTPTKCDQCLSNYFLSGDKLTCTACSDQNCLICSSAALCTSCKSGYYLSQSSCKACAQSNCASCSSAAKCDQCISGYTANLTQISCAYCPFQTCQRCDSDYQCAVCNPQYYFNNVSNSCMSCQSNCLNCTNSTICTQCSVGYYIYNNSCPACPLNCGQCNQTNCISCLSGYGLTSLGQCITCNVGNCLSCSDNNVCSQCVNGYTLNSTSNTCGCSAAQIWNLTLQQCVTCSNLFTNCYSCNFSICLSCIPGYYQPTGSGVCIKCNQDPNCGVCNTTNCLSCVSGYYLLPNNTCSSCFIDCSNCTGAANNQCLSCNTGFSLLSSTNQCATSNCPSTFTNCQSCVRNNNGNLQCVGCINGYFFNEYIGLCDYCHLSCLTCFGKAATNCLTCPNYSLFYPGTNTCAYNCSTNCLTCDGNGASNCLSCPTSMILLNQQCITNNQAIQNISNFTANGTGLTLVMVSFATTIRSFTQKTATPVVSCSNNTNCFNNGECYQSQCLCLNGFFGVQCQISQSDLTLAINTKNQILAYLISTLSSINVTALTSVNSSRILQANSTSSNSTNSSNSNSSNFTFNSSALAITLATIVQLSTPIELWTTASSINTTIFFLIQFIQNNIQYFNQSTITSALQALSNMVYVLNNYNTSIVTLAQSDQGILYQNISLIIQVILNTTLSSLTTTGNTYQIYTPFLQVSLSYIDLSSSQSPKFTLYSSPYYDYNDVYMSQVSFTADSTSLITKINGGNSKVILKQSTWISTDPFPVNTAVQVNLSLATGIASVELFTTTGNYLPISGISDPVAIRIKKIVSGGVLDTTNTAVRYACAFWDNSSLLWNTNGLDNDKTTESQNYIGCYTNHFTDFTVVYRNETDFFALQFVEVLI